MTTTHDPVQDFRAAMREVHTNVEVRRLMFVVVNVLVPTLLMAGADTLSGSGYPPELAWLPANILWIVGALGGAGALLVALVLGRCHSGMVINGSKLRKVTDGVVRPTGLNWLGVTTNLVALAALSGAGGVALLLATAGRPMWTVVPASLCALALPLGALVWFHWRANRTVGALEASWSHGSVPAELREEHAITSLDDTTADIAVVVTMSVALFAGAFNALTNLGAIPAELALPVSVPRLQAVGVPALAGFLLLSIALSLRMVVRLRIALAEHASTLATLRGEHDEPWRFRPIERTYLLYGVALLLCAASALILAWSQAGRSAGLITGGAVLAIGGLYYPLVLRLTRPR